MASTFLFVIFKIFKCRHIRKNNDSQQYLKKKVSQEAHVS